MSKAFVLEAVTAADAVRRHGKCSGILLLRDLRCTFGRDDERLVGGVLLLFAAIRRRPRKSRYHGRAKHKPGLRPRSKPESGRPRLSMALAVPCSPNTQSQTPEVSKSIENRIKNGMADDKSKMRP